MRIPTYSFRNTDRGIEVFGPGIQFGSTYPNLVMIRGRNYRFNCLNTDTILQLTDKTGRILFEADSENLFKEIIFKFGDNFPNEIQYKVKSANHKNQYGKILIRDYNNVTGKVITYGYAKEAVVYDKKYQDHVTDQFGTYQLDLNSYITNSNQTYFVNFDLLASGGFDSAVLNPNNESYSDMLNFNFYAKAGCLNISCLSSVFYFICSKMINVNYREMQSKINSYFQFSRNFDPITDDPIYCYLTNKIPFTDFKNYILLTLVIELHGFLNKEENDTEKLNYVFDKLADNILDDNHVKFTYDSLPDIVYYDKENNDKIRYYNTFENLFFILSERIQMMTDKTTKKVCVLESIYSMIYKFRTAVYMPRLVSSEQFLKDNFELLINTVKVPEQKFYLLLVSSNGCSVAPFGKYAKVQITSELLYNVFNQVLPIEPEVTRNLVDKTIYIKYDKDSNYDYFCYDVVDFIDFDYELYTINEKNKSEEKIFATTIQGFDESHDCCELESAIKSSEQEKNKNLEIVVNETVLFEAVLFDIDKNRTETLRITNRNYPSRVTELEENFYIDDFLDKRKNKMQIPAFICIPNKYATTLKEANGITLKLDGDNRINETTHIRYDFETLKIINSEYENDVLVIETESSHGFNVGDIIIIENASKDGHINGSFEIIGLTGNTKMILDFDLPIGVESADIKGSYAEIKSLNTTRIYTENTSFQINDFIFFEEAANSIPYRIINIKQDYIGRYLVVEGNVPRNVKSFVKVESKNTRTFEEVSSTYKTLQFSLNKNPQILNLSGIDVDSYKIFIPSVPGELSKHLNSKIISSLVINKKQLQLSDTPTLDDNITDSNVNQTTSSDDLMITNLDSYGMSKKIPLYNKEEIAYHYSRSYLKKEYDLNEYTEVSPEADTFDWNNDGVVGTDELKILERFLLTAPRTVKEYNTNRGDYPMTSVLPNIVTATYACQENCCHDDFTESEDFTTEDVYIYDAFQTYMDSIGIEESDYVEFRSYYDSLVKQGIAEELEQEIVYMPTTPTERKFCGDYTNSGNISPEDAHIYYAHQLYAAANSGEQPSTVQEFATYYDTLVASGIVPSLLTPIEKLPSLADETTITVSEGSLDKNCELITGKDLAIYNEWIRQGKPTDIDVFNENRLEGVPRACFLPADDDGYNPGEYEDIGLGFSEKKIEKVYTGTEHL